jgi:hypothetical protein
MSKSSGGLGIKMRYLQCDPRRKYHGKRVVLYLGDKASIDPESTKHKIKPLVEATPEYKKLGELATRKRMFIDKQQRLLNKHKKLLDPITGRPAAIDQSAERKIQVEYIQIAPKLEAIEKELNAHIPEMEAARLKILKENAVYFTPKDAVLLSPAEAGDWWHRIADLAEDELILESGEVIKQADFETARVEELSQEEKLKEKKAKIGQTLAAAIQFQTELEIIGDKDALQKAQEWCKLEREKIEEQYSG